MKKSLLLVLILCVVSLCFASKVGYALSGGGARGFAHIGVLKVLEEEGIRPDYISGTSIGAIIGAFYAMGYNAAEIESLALAIDWQELFDNQTPRRDLYIGQKRWAPFGNITFELDDDWSPQLPSSVFNVNKVNLKLFELYAPSSQVYDFDDLPIPFSCLATNLITGESKVFRQGSIMQAVRASMSIPSILPPFEVDGNVYIDGGIAQNLPINVVKEMGAETVVGIKVNSSLRGKESINNLIDVLDQTINIGITRNLNKDLDDCHLLLEPELSEYSSTDFVHVRELIALGEAYARTQLPEIRNYKRDFSPESATEPEHYDRKNERYYIESISVRGNDKLSSSKILEYIKLETGNAYSHKELAQACQDAWNSEFFRVVYPILSKSSARGYHLTIQVGERANKLLILNNAYNEEVKLTSSAILRLNNVLLKNSIFLTELQLGGKNELNIDYVKNFGELWGIYYRVFPYVNEKTLYIYDDTHHRTNSVRSLEWGGTSGIGLFSPKQGAAEFFVYRSHTYLYRGIAETPMAPRSYQVSGFGAKGLYESVDDYVFPTSGLRVLGKLNFARDENISDYVYSKFTGKAEAFVPLHDAVSIECSADIGTYFNSAPMQKFDAYPIGGAGGFMAYSKYEISAPHFRILKAGLVLEPKRRFFVSAGVQHLSYDANELWGGNYNTDLCYYLSLGLNASVMPVKLNMAMKDNGRFNLSFSVGYDFDIFKYSRK